MNDRITALYCRVSTEMQRDKGESIANQKSRLTEYAQEKNYKYKIYEDAGFSAKDTNRPAIKQLVDDVKNGKIERILVTKIDRITRRIKDLLDLLQLFEEYDVSFKSLSQPIDTSSAMGRGFLNLLGVFAEMERDMVSERVGEDMRHRAKNGKWNGGVVPYGYKLKDKQLYISPEEADSLKKIYNKYIELESLRGVTQWLNGNGYKTRNNKSWAAASISRLLSNPTYIGKIWYNKRASSKTTGKLKNRPKEEWIINEGNHQPIIDGQIFNTVQKILERQSQEPRRKMSEYLLSGLVRCGKCGGALSGATYRRVTPRNPRVYAYYKCHNSNSKGKAICKGISIAKETLENLVIDKILSLTKSKGFKVDIKKAINKFNQEVFAETKPMLQEKNKLIKRNELIEIKKKNILMLVEDGIINKDDYRSRISELNAELESNQKKVYEIESKLNDGNIEAINFNSIYEIVSNFKENWKYFDTISKKDLLWSLISKIVVDNGKIDLELFFLPGLFSGTDNARLPVRLFRFEGKELPLYGL